MTSSTVTSAGLMYRQARLILLPGPCRPGLPRLNWSRQARTISGSSHTPASFLPPRPRAPPSTHLPLSGSSRPLNSPLGLPPSSPNFSRLTWHGTTSTNNAPKALRSPAALIRDARYDSIMYNLQQNKAEFEELKMDNQERLRPDLKKVQMAVAKLQGEMQIVLGFCGIVWVAILLTITLGLNEALKQKRASEKRGRTRNSSEA